MAKGQSFNGEFVYIILHSDQNYTTGLRGSQARGTVFTLTDSTTGTSSALLAVNAPGTRAKSVPLLPNYQNSVPNAWFNMMDAEAVAVSATSLRCEAQVSTGYLTWGGVEQFNICTVTAYGTRGTEIPAGREVGNLMIMPTGSSPTTSSSMVFNNNMSSTSMISTTTPNHQRNHDLIFSRSTLSVLCAQPPPPLLATGTLAAPTLHPASLAGSRSPASESLLTNTAPSTATLEPTAPTDTLLPNFKI